MDPDDTQNRFSEAPDLEELRKSFKRPSVVGRAFARLRASSQFLKSPTFITAVLALLIVAAIAVGIWAIT